MASNSPVIVLLSIKPCYTNAILDGRKKVEFRKRAFKRAVTHVVIYATNRVKRVIGSFQTQQIEEMAPADLWRRFASVGGISEEHFDAYYDGSDSGVAIHVKRAKRLEPISIKKFKVAAAPQSCVYLSSSAFDHLDGKDGQRAPKRLVGKRKGRKVLKEGNG